MKAFLLAHYEKIILAVFLLAFAALLYNQLGLVRTAQLDYVEKQTNFSIPDPDYNKIDFKKKNTYKMETVFSEGIDTAVASKVFGKRFDTAPFGEKTNLMVPYPMAECVHCHVLIPVDAYPPVDAEEDGSCPVCGKPLSPRVKSEALQPEDDTNFNGISDEWEQQYALTDTSADSDEDGDGFTLKDEFAAKTDPTDPLSHPKYITYLYVDKVTQSRFPGLQLVSVDMSKPDKKDWDIKFNTQVLSGSSVSKKTPIIRIGRPLKNIDSKKKNVDFTVVDIGIDEKTHEPVVYIRRVANPDELIPCRKGKTVLDPQQKVYFKSSLTSWGWEGSYNNGVEFKLGTEKTGEERYKLVSADLETKEAVVESIGETPETLTILPAQKEETAAPAADADNGTLPPGTVQQPRNTGSKQKKQ